MKYSVIVPVYKAEETLERCLNSLIAQPREDVEILLINDGSPDGCGKICEAYAAEHDCIRYFAKENGGVSSARNLAIEKASGKYILFVDSDDYVSEDYFSTLNKAIDEKHPDMLLFGYKNFNGGNSAWNCGNFFADEQTDIAKKASQIIREYLFSSLLSKAFKREIIANNRLMFENDLAIGEDQAFIFKYATFVKSLMSVDATLYFVDVGNQGSLSRKRRDYLAEQLVKSNAKMIEAADNSALPKKVKTIYAKALSWMFYRSAYSSCKELLKYDLNKKQRRKKIREICGLYNSKRVKIRQLKSLIIALPVKFKMAAVIDYLIKK